MAGEFIAPTPGVQVNLQVAHGFAATVEAGRDGPLVLAVGVSGLRLAVFFGEGSGPAGLAALRRFAAAVQVFATMAEARELQRTNAPRPVTSADLLHVVDSLRD
ncbi:hypothetical protein [Catellatospora methionotrophica]|uniref:hypothetical protein n=1 Tax=Catellatospora methionotrophica TaxID=121620 RepID=UPI0033F4C292